MGPAELPTPSARHLPGAGKALAKKFSKDEADVPQVLANKVRSGTWKKTGQGFTATREAGR